MSIKFINYGWDTNYVGATRLVLLALASYADEDGECWPSLTSLARRAGCSRAQVCVSLKRLVADGTVTKVTGGGRTSNRYRLNLNGSQASLPQQSSDLTSQVTLPQQSSDFTPAAKWLDPSSQVARPQQSSGLTRKIIESSENSQLNHQLTVNTRAARACADGSDDSDGITLTRETVNEMTRRAVEAYERRVDRDNPHVAQYPPDVQPALALLWEIWRFRAPPRPRQGKRGGQYAFWIDATRELMDVCGGELEGVLKAIRRSQDALPAHKRLSLAGPQSLIGLARAEMSRRLSAPSTRKDDPAYWGVPAPPPAPDPPSEVRETSQEPPELEAMRAELKRRQEVDENQPCGFDAPSAEAALRAIRALAEQWRSTPMPTRRDRQYDREQDSINSTH